MRVYLDVETSGLDPESHCVLQLGVAIYDDNWALVRELDSLVRPMWGMLEEEAASALEVNGLKWEELLQAPPAEEVAKKLHDLMLYALSCAASFHAFNVAFDSRFLAQPPWLIPPPGKVAETYTENGWQQLGVSPWAECVMLAATPPGGRWPKLGVAVERFGLDWAQFGKAHTALADAKAAAAIHRKILESRSPVTL